MVYISISEVVIVFFLFSILGWCMEVFLKYLEFHRFINRGFLIGPYCPIYGAGVAGIIIIIGKWLQLTYGFILVFIAGFFICGLLEYLVSWIMEKQFHARWWDYSQRPMNLHGRIWIGNLVLFGLAAVVIINFIYPPLRYGLDSLTDQVKNILAVCIFIEMMSDYILSQIVLKTIKDEIDGTELDDSEEISTKVKEALKDRSALVNRILASYPTMKVSPEVIKQKIKEREEKAKAMIKRAEHVAIEAVEHVDHLLDEKRNELYVSLSEKAADIGDLIAYIDDLSKEERVLFLQENLDNLSEEVIEKLKHRKKDEE